MKKALPLLLSLVVVGLALFALGGGSSTAQAQPPPVFQLFLPFICRNCDPTQPPSVLKITQELVQPINGVAQSGDQVEFRVTIKNTGDTDILELPLDDVFDLRYLEFVSAFPAPDLAVAGTLQWRDLTTYLPRGLDRRLLPGQSFNMTLRFKVVGCPAEAPVTNQVSISNAVDGNNAKVRLATAGASVHIACLNLEVTTPPRRTQAHLGEVVDFMIILRNTGNAPIVSLPLEQVFDPTIYKLVSAEPAPSHTEPSTGTLHWTELIGAQPLAPGGRLVVSLKLQVMGCPSSGEATNTAFVDGAAARVNRAGSTPIEFLLPAVTSNSTLAVPCAELAIDKTMTSPTSGDIRPGDRVSFAIRVNNTGNKPIKALPIQDVFDANLLDFVDATPAAGTPIDGQVEWNDLLSATGHSGYLMPGETVTATATFQVAECPLGRPVINRAAINGAIAVQDGQEYQVPVVSTSATFQVACTRPTLEVTKTLTSASGEVANGDLVTFTVAIKNAGYWPVVTLPLEDEYDSRYLEFVDSNVRPDSMMFSALRWLNLSGAAPGGFGAPLEPGQTINVVTTFRVTGCPADMTTINAARIFGAIAEHNGRQYFLPVAEATSPLSITCLGVKVTKSLAEPTGPSALLGEEVVFSFTVENTGNITLTTVPFEDAYNTGHLRFKSASIPGAVDANGVVSFVDLTTTFGDLAPGQKVTFTLTFEAIGCPVGQTTTDTARITGATATSPTATYNVPASTSAGSVDIACPDITVKKSVVAPLDGVVNRFDANDTVTFNIVLTATGNKDITLLPLEDNYDPRYLEVVSASPPPNIMTPGSLKWMDLTRTGTNGFGRELRIGETFTVTVTARGVGCPVDQVATNYAEVREARGRHNGNYFLVDPTSDSTEIRVACPMLEVTKTLAPLACGVAGMNEPVTFNVRVANTGNTILRTVSLTDTYPALFLRYNSAQPQPNSATVQGDTGTLIWQDLTGALPFGVNADLPPGGAINVTLAFTTLQSTQRLDPPEIRNQVQVSGFDEYGHPSAALAASSGSARLSVADADLIIDKLVNPASLPTHPGGLITYQVSYRNDGPDNATYVRILDTIPAGTEFVGDTLCGHVNTGCYRQDLAAGAGGSFSVTVRVPFGVLPGTVETNTIRIDSGYTPDGVICGIPDRNDLNNVASAGSTVLADFSRLPDQSTYSEDFTQEWLGQIVVGETAAPDGEAENDGWTGRQAYYLVNRPVEVNLLLNTTGEGAARYGLAADEKLYLRGWVDRNTDGVFSDDELVMSWSGAPGTVGKWDYPANQPPDGTWNLDEPTHHLTVSFAAPLVNGYTTLRLRLGYGQPPAAQGVEHYGEIEDYQVRFLINPP